MLSLPPHAHGVMPAVGRHTAQKFYFVQDLEFMFHAPGSFARVRSADLSLWLFEESRPETGFASVLAPGFNMDVQFWLFL